MIPELRRRFNNRFEQSRYEAMLAEINRRYDNSLVFRVSETPLFLTGELTRHLLQACHDIVTILRSPEFLAQVEDAVPPGMRVAREDAHPTFLQLDFAICGDEQGGFVPRLIELQGFPSLYCYQHMLDRMLRRYFGEVIPEVFTPFFSGLDSEGYRKLLGEILVGDCDPENVVVMDLCPHEQKTRIDFYLAQEYYGIRPVCVTEVIQRGNRLYYRDNRREVPIHRIYHRFIFDELHKKGVQPSFRYDDEDVEVTWVGHPNWFFKVSKYALPLLNSPYCPPAYYLRDLETYPEDLENYVLKPLFSFAGMGVAVDLTRELLDSIEDRENYLLQRKVEYAPVIETPDEYAKAEVRMMLVWQEEPMVVNNLLRTSKGKMMGVDYNKDKTWVGSSLAYHEPM